jgi:DNA-binding CsgD family transcriptional regulator
MPISDDFLITCSINTIKEDFSERDKLILSLIAPHLANAIRNSFAYERLNFALETEESGVIAINSKGKALFISEYAGMLLEKYFAAEKRKANSLPETLTSWIKQFELDSEATNYKTPLPPMKIENQEGALTIRFMYNSTTGEKTLLLEEKKLLSSKAFEKLNLTKRESEILFWITQGKTDSVIADLCGISIRTVHKHIESIYTKLGAENRTSAMSKALENI